MRAAQFFYISASSRPNRSKICVIPDRIGLKSVKSVGKKKSSKEKICVICEICVTTKSPDYFRNRGFLIQEGGYLLSRIALQYHRRK